LSLVLNGFSISDIGPKRAAQADPIGVTRGTFLRMVPAAAPI
jgi:hypothetical protein